MKMIAVIEDDQPIGNLLEESLTREGYEVLRAYSGTEALYLLEKHRPDLILLDLMLPGLSGEELLSRLSGIPVIVVSAKAGIDDKVKLLLEGAADYITKPFALKELLARITVQLRRTEAPRLAPVLEAGDLRLDTESHELTLRNIPVRLTRTEYAILKLLLQRPGQVIARSVLLEYISQDTPDCSDGSLKQHISNLRKKLRDIDGHDYIEAVWGIGFRLVLPNES
ncbi:MAG: response regulator transcription factor [Lachnospiraceae bacterium]|nr:response regulator transcription factor [Lachnospiraceae bacterium]